MSPCWVVQGNSFFPLTSSRQIAELIYNAQHQLSPPQPSLRWRYSVTWLWSEKLGLSSDVSFREGNIWLGISLVWSEAGTPAREDTGDIMFSTGQKIGFLSYEFSRFQMGFFGWFFFPLLNQGNQTWKTLVKYFRWSESNCLNLASFFMVTFFPFWSTLSTLSRGKKYIRTGIWELLNLKWSKNGVFQLLGNSPPPW